MTKDEPKRFYLSQTNKQLSGVCGGLAEYFNLDVTIVRIVVIVGTIFTGFFPGIIAYIAIAAIAPKGPEPVAK